MILSCRVCGGNRIKNILSLGFTPLANALLTKEQLDQPEEKYPLDLVFCEDCTLVQIVETVPPEKLFSNYFYNSSISQTTLKNAEDLVEYLIKQRNLKPYGEKDFSCVVEVGSNDGYLLKNYVKHGIKVIGIEPAENIADKANKAGVRTINGFFNEKTARQLVGNGSKEIDSKRVGWNFHADVIHANNVLAHVADLHSVIEGIKILLAPDGVAVVETHYVRDLVDQLEFDCIYHEHLCYYSLHSIKELFELHGLALVDVERIPIHGGSLRVYFQREDGPKSYNNPLNIENRLTNEREWGVKRIGTYRNLESRIIELKKSLWEVLDERLWRNEKIVGYGATAKSTTLLNYFGIDNSVLDYMVDATPDKQNHYTPGTHIPIYSPESLMSTLPNCALLTAWNFVDEILAKEEPYRKAGGKFIVPIPELKTL